MKHYRTFNKKCHNKRTAFERSVIIYWEWGWGLGRGLKLALRDPNPLPQLSWYHKHDCLVCMDFNSSLYSFIVISMDVSDQPSQSDLSLGCPPEEALDHWPSTVGVSEINTALPCSPIHSTFIRIWFVCVIKR